MNHRLAAAFVLVAALIAACSAGSGATPPASTPIDASSSPAASSASANGPSAAPSDSTGVPEPSATASAGSASGGPDYRGDGASRTLMYSVVKCHGPTGGSWNVDIRESSGGGAFTFYEIPDGSDQATAQVEYEMLLGDPENLEGTGTFVAGDPPHFLIENGEGRTDIELEVGTFCR